MELVLVAGQLDQSRMKEYLYGPFFEVEVHDRDRIIHKFEEGNSLFGEERDDGLLSFLNTGLCFSYAFVCFHTLSFNVHCNHLGISRSVENAVILLVCL